MNVLQMMSFMLSCLKSSGANTLKRKASGWKANNFLLEPEFTKTFGILPTEKFFYTT